MLKNFNQKNLKLKKIIKIIKNKTKLKINKSYNNKIKIKLKINWNKIKKIKVLQKRYKNHQSQKNILKIKKFK